MGDMDGGEFSGIRMEWWIRMGVVVDMVGCGGE